MKFIKQGAQLAFVLAMMGGAIGIFAGFWSNVRADGAEAVAAQSTPLYWLLALALPLTLWLVVQADRDSDTSGAYTGLASALMQVVTAGVVGVFFGSGFYLMGSFLIPANIGGEDPVELMEALQPGLLGKVPIVFAIVIVASIGIAVQANRQTE